MRMDIVQLETLSVTSSLMDREAECAFYDPAEK